MPKERPIAYHVTSYGRPEDQVQTLAVDNDGHQLKDAQGNPYHHLVRYRDWLEQEARRIRRRVTNDVGVIYNRDGHVALVVYAR